MENTSEETAASIALKSCGLCEVKPSKYCCPRCNVNYCSVDCYKSEKHSECSEDFYKQCVNEELVGDYGDVGSRNKMIGILQRMNGFNPDDYRYDEFDELEKQMAEGVRKDVENREEELTLDSDDEVFVALEDRVKGLDLDDADSVWDVLTEGEQNEFEAILNQGNVENIIPQWEPWWSYQRREKPVQELSSNADDEEKEHMAKCPAVMKIPKFSDLTSVQPSKTIRYNITNCLASYAFINRYFNGDLDPVEASAYLLEVCANLANGTIFENASFAVESVTQRCLQSTLIQTDRSSSQTLHHDTFVILQGPSRANNSFYCKAALSHIHHLLSECRKTIKSSESKKPTESSECKKPKKTEGSEKAETSKEQFSKKFPEANSEHLPKLDASKFKKCMKKIVYYLAYVESCQKP